MPKKYIIAFFAFVLLGAIGFFAYNKITYNHRIPLECETRGTWIGMRKECDFGSFPFPEINDYELWCRINSGYYAVKGAEPNCACIPSAKCVFNSWKYEN